MKVYDYSDHHFQLYFRSKVRNNFFYVWLSYKNEKDKKYEWGYTGYINLYPHQDVCYYAVKVRLTDFSRASIKEEKKAFVFQLFKYFKRSVLHLLQYL